MTSPPVAGLVLVHEVPILAVWPDRDAGRHRRRQVQRGLAPLLPRVLGEDRGVQPPPHSAHLGCGRIGVLHCRSSTLHQIY
jgi:hypothetical protein